MRAREDEIDALPSDWVVRWATRVRPGGLVLDLAAGDGRHARHFLGLGHLVVAADREPARLEAAFGGNPACRVVRVDLEAADLDKGAWALGEGYDGIVVANYLHRPLLPILAAALAPGGALIYETFMQGNERFGRPSNPDFLLRPNELLDVYAKRLTIVDFEQGLYTVPRRAMRQRLAATKGRSDAEGRV